MTILKVLLFLGVAFGAFTVYAKYRQKFPAGTTVARASAKDPGLSPAGFFLLTRDEARNDRVTIMSVPNCPSHETARAEYLAAMLNAAGVPCELKQHIGFTFTDPDDMARVQKYTTGVGAPLVLVRGWAKGNPSEEDIIAQYRGQ